MHEVRLVGFIALTIGFFLTGCHLRPSFREAPGTIHYQRGRAVVHDPFPDNSIGPAVMGGRPSGFERPLSEPTRIQTTSPSRSPGF